MGEKTKIEWCDHTFNPWIGCAKVAPGCANCYAERDFDKRRHVAEWGPNGTRVVTSDGNWAKVQRWDKSARKAGRIDTVFCASLADVFEAFEGHVTFGSGGAVGYCDNCGITAFGLSQTPPHCLLCKSHARLATLDDARERLFWLIDKTPNLRWLLLTKRPQHVRRMWPLTGTDIVTPPEMLVPFAEELAPRLHRSNVAVGCSVSDQATAEESLPQLIELRDLTPTLFVSVEPLLGPVDLSPWLSCPHGAFSRDVGGDWACDQCGALRGQARSLIDWVIVGGESGPNARPMHPDWARSLRDQCQAAGVPLFFKQWGEWIQGDAVPGGDLGGDMRSGKAAVVHLVSHAREELCRRSVFPGDVIVRRVGKAAAGRLLDGREWNETPWKNLSAAPSI